MERGHDLLYVCFDNEAYMNTGIQRSGATPFGASTTTNPSGTDSFGKGEWKKNIAAIMAAHDIPYIATACHSYPIDLMNKVKKAQKIKGPTFIHCLAVCPTGWRMPSNLCIKMGRLAVETGVFPLYEVENGRYKLNMDIDKLRPVKDYLKTQGRFGHLEEGMIEKIQERVTQEYEKLERKVSMNEGA